MEYEVTRAAPQIVGSGYAIEEIKLEDGTVWRALEEWGSFVRMYDHNGQAIVQQMPMNADGKPCADEFCDVFEGECDPGFWEAAVKAIEA